jgi:hypothetical protein
MDRRRRQQADGWTHGSKSWDIIAALVPGRTKIQCCSRWHDVLLPSIDRVNMRTGTWAEEEDIKLKDAVLTHGGNNWGAIAALVPGRVKRLCWDRWKNHTERRTRHSYNGTPTLGSSLPLSFLATSCLPLSFLVPGLPLE